jgi:hypothetical protein
MQGSEASGLEANRHVLHAYRYLYEINRHGMFVYIRMQNSILITCHMRRRIHACHMRRRIHACHMRRRIHACHMRRSIIYAKLGGQRPRNKYTFTVLICAYI